MSNLRRIEKMKIPKQHFWYNPETQKAGFIPTGCRAGQFLFLSSQMPVDLETGQLIRYPWELPAEGRGRIMTGWEFFDARLGPIRAQTWMIYNNLSKVLAQQDSSLKNIIRQRIYLRDAADTGAMEEVMLSFFPEDKPATMIIGVASHGISSDICVQVEVIALVPQGDGLRGESVYIPELASVTAPYPQAVKVGQFLFISGLLGINPETGKVATKLQDLGADMKLVQTGHRQTDSTAEAMKAQFWLTDKLLDRIIKSQGGSGLKDILRKNQFFRRGMKEVAGRYPLRAKLFKTREDSPAVTIFGTRNLSSVEEAMIVTDAVAILPGEYRKEVNAVPDRTLGLYPMWTKGGPFWFVSGELGLNYGEHQAIHSFSDLPDTGRFLAQVCFHDANTITMAQAWRIYQSLDRMMREAGSDLSKVLQQSIYIRNVQDYLAVERVASIVYQGQIPPTVLVPVDEIGPYEELRMEIETISLII
jgi:enamine deaminase RidA (YjgF/YER057c/UK114 family)